MPTINLNTTTLEKLQTLASAKLTLHASDGPNCSHWRLEAEGQQIACACDASALESILGTLQEVTASIEQQTENERHKARSSRASSVPTPGDITLKPLSYRPPSYVDPGQVHLSYGVEDTLKSLGVGLEDVYSVLADPLEVLPSSDFRSVYRGERIEVLFAQQSKTVLAVHVAGTFKPAGVPRLPGQKEKRQGALPTTVAEMAEHLKGLGFVLAHGGKHWKISHPDFPGVYASMPYTPSDYRWAHNLASELFHKYAIDIRSV